MLNSIPINSTSNMHIAQNEIRTGLRQLLVWRLKSCCTFSQLICSVWFDESGSKKTLKRSWVELLITSMSIIDCLTAKNHCLLNDAIAEK